MSLSYNHIDVVIRHTGGSYDWEEHPGIEWWGVEALLCSDKLSAEIVIATASLWRVDLELCTDIVFELDSISGDLGEIASAITNSEGRLNEPSLVVGNNSSLLIAEDALWTGSGVGMASGQRSYFSLHTCFGPMESFSLR